MKKVQLESIFLRNDIRGVYGDILTKELGHVLGLAVATYFDSGTFVIGGDTRPSTTDLKNSLIEGLLLGGALVHDVGVVPTPGIYYICAESTIFTCGIIITASHNPIEFNGVKICNKNGEAYSYDTFFSKILDIIVNKTYYKSHTKGKLHTSHYLVNEYINFLGSLCKFKNKLNIAVEYGKGTTSLLTKILGDKVNLVSLGENTNMASQEFTDPAKENTFLNLQRLVEKSNFQIGIVFDTDGDRVGFVDEVGKVIPPCIITMLFIEKIAKTTQPKILIDVKLSQAIHDFGAQFDAIVEFTPVGHSVIHHNLVSKNFDFASELSCHYYFNLDYYGFDDGLYAAIQVLQLLDEMVTTNTSLSEKITKYPHYFPSNEYREKLNDNIINNILKELYKLGEKMNGKLILLDGVRCETPEGWFLARKSSTEPLLSYRVEGKTKTHKNYFLNLVRNVIKEEKRTYLTSKLL